MAKQDTVTGKVRKFLFDQHNFDEDFEEEPEVPPPPVFSEEELRRAQSEEYERGRKDAFAEAAASREKQVAALLESINRNFSQLFKAEEGRAALYEAEALQLAQIILEKLFPALNEKHGLEEIKEVIEKVLQGQKSQPEILIEVNDGYVNDVKAHIETAMRQMNSPCQCSVKGGANLGPGDCRMNWQNGGAVRDAALLAAKIESELELALADRPRLGDNGKDNPAGVEISDE